MTTKAIPSLGDEAERPYKTVQEKYDLPVGGRKALLQAIEQILGGGGVQRLVLKVGDKIRVSRKVIDDGTSDSLNDLIHDDLMDASRNVVMEEFSPSQNDKLSAMSSFEVLFRAFHLLSTKRIDGRVVKPRAVLVRKLRSIRNWLEEQRLLTVFGVEIIEHPEIPDDVALIVCTDSLDEEDVLFSLKLNMDQLWRSR